MNFMVLFLTFLLSANTYSIDKGLGEAISLIRNDDGTYNVKCVDGVIENLSSQDVLNNNICKHIIIEDIGLLKLVSQASSEPNLRMCDYTIVLKKSTKRDFFESYIKSEKICGEVIYKSSCYAFSDGVTVDCSSGDLGITLSKLGGSYYSAKIIVAGSIGEYTILGN
jgi:hypothetical protein